jgi:predicted permease
MIGSTIQLLEGVVIMLVLITFTTVLKKTGIVDRNSSTIFGNLVLKVTLPALIFTSLAVHKFSPDLLLSAGIVSIVEISCIFLAWILAKIIKLDRGETGALMLVSAFGMSAMLGYPIIEQVFPNNSQAIADAVITSELGVGLVLFILGPIIAIHYGGTKVDNEKRIILSSIKKFLLSPIFVAIILGIIVSYIPIPSENQVVITLRHLLKHVSNANMFLVALTVGLIIEFDKKNNQYIFFAAVIIIKLILQPILSQFLGFAFDISTLQKEIILIETAMPSAILVAIFANQYQCKPQLVSKAIIITLIISLVSVTSIYSFFY